MERKCWLTDNIAIAKKVKHGNKSPPLQIKDCGASRECPQCHYLIDNSDVTDEWLGLPAGVKFDPSDLELIQHLTAKCGVGTARPHMLIDEFIPTLDGNQGINNTHPENLPGVMKDGSTVHFFHKTANAYATGQRKRRKIQLSQPEKQVRWHKTGKTKSVLENGIQKGCKKIMVLYHGSRKGFKADKANWVMHQYHLGADDDEKEDEFVVSKIFYQLPKQTEQNENVIQNADVDALHQNLSPKTPNLSNCRLQQIGTSLQDDDFVDSTAPVQFNPTSSYDALSPANFMGVDFGVRGWLAGESQPQAVGHFGLNDFDESLICKQITGSYPPLSFNDPGTSLATSVPTENNRISCGFTDLENLELETLPELSLTGLSFGSQDSVFDGLDHL